MKESSGILTCPVHTLHFYKAAAAMSSTSDASPRLTSLPASLGLSYTKHGNSDFTLEYGPSHSRITFATHLSVLRDISNKFRAELRDDDTTYAMDDEEALNMRPSDPGSELITELMLEFCYTGHYTLSDQHNHDTCRDKAKSYFAQWYRLDCMFEKYQINVVNLISPITHLKNFVKTAMEDANASTRHKRKFRTHMVVANCAPDGQFQHERLLASRNLGLHGVHGVSQVCCEAATILWESLGELGEDEELDEARRRLKGACQWFPKFGSDLATYLLGLGFKIEPGNYAVGLGRILAQNDGA